MKLAEKYKFLVEKNSDLKFDLKTYFYDAVCHIIIETKDGHKNEEEFIDYLKKQGYNCYFPDGRIDAKFGIDVIAEKNEKTFFVQVKPLTFFLSQRRDVYEDRVKLCRKYEEALEKYNTVTYYAIHSKQNGGTYWVKNGNGFCFRMTDLFSYEKENIDGTYKEIHSLRNGDINYGLLT